MLKTRGTLEVRSASIPMGWILREREGKAGGVGKSWQVGEVWGERGKAELAMRNANWFRIRLMMIAPRGVFVCVRV